MGQALKTGTLLSLIVLGMLLALFLLYKLGAFVLLILISVVFTAGIDPPVKWLQNRRRGRLPRSLAVLIVLAVAIIIFVGLVSFLVVTAVTESISFVHNTWPTLEKSMLHRAQQLSARYSFIPRPEVVAERLRAQTGQLGSYLWSTTKAVFGVLGGFVSALTVIVLTFLFATFTEDITRTFGRFIPPRHRSRVWEITHLAAAKMGGWVRGQLTLALVVAVIILVAMYILGVPYAALIGVAGGVGELIPMVGIWLALISAVLIVLAAKVALWKLFAVLAFFVVLGVVENYLLTPRIMKRAAELSPVTTILALLVGGGLLGPAGALLAIPFTAAGRVVLNELVFPAIEGRAGTAPVAEGGPPGA